jgi:peptidoglycan/LPS O-acetylase OafA/YrhL
MTSPSGTGNKDYIPTLDGLRALAIAMVIASHAIPYSEQHAIQYREPPLWANGHVGVLIFFALSGYLITTHLLRQFDATGRISLRDFYLRRSFRILPSVIVYLTTLMVLAAFGLVPFGWNSFRAALFFYPSYVDHSWTIGHFWSLAVEEHFYLLWPLLLVVFGVRTGWRTAIAFVFVVASLRFAVNHYHLFDSLFRDRDHGNYHSDLVFDALLWGCILAFVLRRPRTRPVNAILSTIIALAAAAVMSAPPGWKLNQTLLIADFLPAVFVGAIAVAPHAPIGRFLELGAVRFVGRLSYSLYIWQELFLQSSEPRLKLIYALPAIIACALLSYRFVERPAIKFGRRFIENRMQTMPIVDPVPTQK